MRYRVNVGLQYPTANGLRSPVPGEVVDDIPEVSLPWLLEQGLITPLPEEVTGDGEVRI